MSASPRTAEFASVELRRRVEWADTDAAGIAHWLACFRLVEVAESALHTSLATADTVIGALPRLGVSISYHGPLRFNDLAVIHLAVVKVGRSSVRYSFSITSAGESVAGGTLDACFINVVTGRARAWPDDLRAMLESGGPQSPSEGR